MFIMLKKTVLLLIVLLLSSSSLLAKPAPSIALSMSWVPEKQMSIPVTIRIQTTSAIESKKLRLTVTLPDGVTLVKGDLNQEIAIEKNKPLETELEVIVSEQAFGEIQAEASIGTPGQMYFYAASALPLNNEATSHLKPRERPQTNHRIIERNGVKIREYQLPN